MSHISVGEHLTRLKARSGLSLAQIAEQAGYKGASSIQKLFSWNYDPPELNASTAEKLAKALVGKGNPSILAEELTALTGNASGHDRALATSAARLAQRSSSIPIVHTRRYDTNNVDVDDFPLPLFKLDVAIARRVRCPRHLQDRVVIGFYVSRGNMSPRFQIGDVVFYESITPPRQGEYVIVRIRAEEWDEKYFIGQLVESSDLIYRFRQFDPDRIIEVLASEVAEVKRALNVIDIFEDLQAS